MFKFRNRTLVKQDGSYLISLPMKWIKSVDSEVKTVMVDMNSENRLKIIAVDTLQNTAAIEHFHSGECR